MVTFSSVFDTETASTSITEARTGSHLFKVIGYSLVKGIGAGNCITSDTFSAGGFIWSIGYYPDGKSAYLPDRNCLGFSVNLRSDALKARVNITLTMLSQTEGLPIKSYSTGTITISNCGYCYYSNFIKRHEFEASQYLKVPELDDDDKGNKDASIALAQHLMVAADRYGLERLKELCEMKIYQFIDENNVATTLTLAEQHTFSELKAVCMEFLKPPEVFAAVALTEGFEHMFQSCPTIREELRKSNVGGR
ncbi:hypothetical protein LUZ63_016444 [Rhynchospora breviuscula]|uniref:MATH domain-containing protein n=1 Tax=Rhynchospora breviuscula TaxID=2022672 RepID=A0A9Q0C106_9POAL|nr:hypothetical protein LUZ63_016444 [Rhynchospora breviuscula]